jgi:glycosyltransferase involved in cell wall biosynthesis
MIVPQAETTMVMEGSEGAGRPNQPTRVGFVIDRLLAGGTELQLLELIRFLDRRCIQPYLFLLDGEDALSRSLEPADCPVLRFGVRRLRSRCAFRSAWRFARLLRRERIDILQLYSYRDSVAFGTLVGRLAGMRHILRVRNNLGHWMTPGDRRLYRLLNRWIELTLTNSEAGRQAAMDQEGIPRDSVVILPNSIDVGRFGGANRGGIRVAGTSKRVGIVANLRYVKGIDVFLDAAALLRSTFPGVAFAIAGEGEEGPELRRRADALGLGHRVDFLGRVRDVASFLDGLDVAVLSSRAEGLSNALLEYMAAGRAIVVTAVGANTDLIEDGVHGLIVRPDDPHALASAIGRLISDEEFAACLGRKARQRVRDRFSPEERARSVADLYVRIMTSVPENSKSRTIQHPRGRSWE